MLALASITMVLGAPSEGSTNGNTLQAPQGATTLPEIEVGKKVPHVEPRGTLKMWSKEFTTWSDGCSACPAAWYGYIQEPGCSRSCSWHGAHFLYRHGNQQGCGFMGCKQLCQCGIPDSPPPPPPPPPPPSPPPPSPPPPPSHQIVDGHSDKDSGTKCAAAQNGLSVLVDEGHPNSYCAVDDNMRVAGVRCCRNNVDEVSDVDKIKDSCEDRCERVTYAEAVQACASMNSKKTLKQGQEWRLCSANEAMTTEDVTYKGGKCAMAYAFIWTSDECDTPDTPAEFGFLPTTGTTTGTTTDAETDMSFAGAGTVGMPVPQTAVPMPEPAVPMPESAVPTMPVPTMPVP